MRNRALWGLIFLAAGTTALAIQTGLLHPNVVQLWPVLVIVFGLWLTLDAIGQPGRRGVTGGLVATAAGAYFLAEKLGLLPQGLFFPIVLLALGAGLLFRSTTGDRR